MRLFAAARDVLRVVTPEKGRMCARGVLRRDIGRLIRQKTRFADVAAAPELRPNVALPRNL